MKDDEYFTRVEKIRDKLYRMAYPYFESESMAIDMVDEAIYKGYLKRKHLKEEQYMETWLVRILLNLCKNKYKKSKREQALEAFSIEEFEKNQVQSDFANLSLREAMDKLPVEYKRIILLKYFGGYKTVEIANILEIPQGTVATRLRKALSVLRVDLEE